MKRKKKNSDVLQEYIKLFPIIFAIAIVPLLVRFNIYNPMLSDYSWFSAANVQADFYTICKQGAIYFLDVLVVFGIIQLALKNELQWTKAFIPLVIYGAFILCSTFVSVSPYHSWNGFYNIMESTGVLLGYCGICYYTYTIVQSEKQIKIIMFSLFLSIVIICGIGLTQLAGNDFLVSDLGKFIIFPSEYASYRDGIQQNFQGVVSSTLFNPNYVGVYACIIVPILLSLAFSVKKPLYLILYFILLALTLTTMIGAGSKTAFLTMIPCFIFLVFYFGKQFGKKIIPFVVLFVLIVGGITIYQGEDSLLITTLRKLTSKPSVTKEYMIEDITLNDEDYIIRFKNTDLKISYRITESSYSLVAMNEDGNEIPVIYSEKKYFYLEDNFYEGLAFTPLINKNTQIGFTIECEETRFPICYSQSDKSYYFVNEYGRLMKLHRGEMFDLPIFHLMKGFSGRDYIWQYSVPLLKQTFFLGSGPDTYAFLFPQYDYVGKLQDKRESLTITKPHNIYLQIGIQTGVLSLVSYLAFYILYFIDSAKLYLRRTLNSFTERCGAGIFLGSICYMLAGLLNDSSIGVSIVFWTLLGLGYCCNRMVKNAEVKQSASTSIVKKTKRNAFQIILICLVCTAIIFTGHFVSNALLNVPVDGRTIFTTTMLSK